MEVVQDPERIELAYAHQYEIIAANFAALAHRRKGVLAEIGCGEGQLTIPLANLLPGYRFELVDDYKGPYSDDRAILALALSKARLKKRIEVNLGDYLDWMSRQSVDSYDLAISSEFLPEIDSFGLSKFMSECYRVTKHSGLTVHSFLSPVPRNSRQRLMIEADSNPRWTKTPPKEWFSPKPSLVLRELRRAGFRNLRVDRIQSNLVIKGPVVKNFLHSWDVKSSFRKTYNSQLAADGLEIPDWIIISALKK